MATSTLSIYNQLRDVFLDPSSIWSEFPEALGGRVDVVSCMGGISFIGNLIAAVDLAFLPVALVPKISSKVGESQRVVYRAICECRSDASGLDMGVKLARWSEWGGKSISDIIVAAGDVTASCWVCSEGCHVCYC